MKLNDKNVQKIIKDIKNLNWAGYKLYLVGGIIENKWDSKDIDICVTGEKILPHLKESLNKATNINPSIIDIFYKKAALKAYDCINGKVSVKDLEFAVGMEEYKTSRSSHKRFKGEWRKDGLFWVSPKYLNKYKQKRNYTEDPMLIYDGTV
jgi:tRNA nucleotidyltransferase/poly(A) polymerase